MIIQTEPEPMWKKWQISGETILTTVKNVVHRGNVRRIIIAQHGQTVVELPLTIGVVGTLLAPTVAAIGVISALLTNCTIEVERIDSPAQINV